MSFLFKHSPFSFFLESEKLVLVNALIDNSFSSCFDISFYTSFFIGNKNNEFYWNVCPNAPSSTVFFFFRGISFSISWQNFQGWLLSQKSRICLFSFFDGLLWSLCYRQHLPEKEITNFKLLNPCKEIFAVNDSIA